MQITDVRIKKNDNEGVLKAMASVVIDDAIVIHNIKLLDNGKGFFISMPSRKSDKGFVDYVHPINQEIRNQLQNAIIEEYGKAVKAKGLNNG